MVRKGDSVDLLVTDHHNTPLASIDIPTQAVQRRRETPFGVARSSPTGWPAATRGFIGGQLDDANRLVHLGAREYDPLYGRFLSVDPVLAPEQSQSLNGYGYGGNNPATNADPTGLYYPEPDGGGAGGGSKRSTPPRGPNGEDRWERREDDRERARKARRPSNGEGRWERREEQKELARGAHLNRRPSPVMKKPEPITMPITALNHVFKDCESVFNCLWRQTWRAATDNPQPMMAPIRALEMVGINTAPDYLTIDVSAFAVGGKHLAAGSSAGLTVSSHGQVTANEPRGGAGSQGLGAGARLGWLSNRRATRDEVNGFLQGDATSVTGTVPVYGGWLGPAGGVTLSDTSNMAAVEGGVGLGVGRSFSATRTYGHVWWEGW